MPTSIQNIHARNTGEHFSLHTRKKKDGSKVWYCQFRLPSGSWGNALSTGIPYNPNKKDHNMRLAEAWARDELSKGQIIFKKGVTLAEFAKIDFFKYGNEWEMNKRITAKKTPSLRWCMERTDLLKNHVLPDLGHFRLSSIDEDVIVNYRNDLFMGKYGREYGGAMINKILTTLREILKAAYKKKLVKYIPEFELAAVNERPKGRLTRKQAQQLFSMEWSDQRSFIASLIAASTGMRLSEIRALKVDDIQPDGKITICKAYDRRTGVLKERTKSGKIREVKLPASHLAAVLRYINGHPYKAKNGFLIYSQKETVPASELLIMKALNEALEKIGIGKAERQTKGISFHSWRRYAISVMLENGVSLIEVRDKVGHAEDDRITQRYFRGSEESRIPSVMEDALPLPGNEETETHTVN